MIETYCNIHHIDIDFLKSFVKPFDEVFTTIKKEQAVTPKQLNELLECLLNEQKFSGQFDFSPEEQKKFDQLIYPANDMGSLVYCALGEIKYHGLIENILCLASSERLVAYLTYRNICNMTHYLGKNEALQILSSVLRKHTDLLNNECFLKNILEFAINTIIWERGNTRLFQNYILLLMSNCTSNQGALLSSLMSALPDIFKSFERDSVVLDSQEISHIMKMLNGILQNDFAKIEEKMTDNVCHPSLLAELKKCSFVHCCVSFIAQLPIEQIRSLIDDKDFTAQLHIINQLEHTFKKLTLLEPFFNNKTKSFNFLKDIPDAQKELLSNVIRNFSSGDRTKMDCMKELEGYVKTTKNPERLSAVFKFITFLALDGVTKYEFQQLSDSIQKTHTSNFLSTHPLAVIVTAYAEKKFPPALASGQNIVKRFGS